MSQKITIVAVTACISGVAHTYMAAEKLQQIAKKHEFALQIETQGALGVDNLLSQDAIQAADLAVICADINIEGIERFDGRRRLQCPIRVLLKTPEAVVSAIQRLALLPQGTVVTL
jgi:fructose-specific PTS system IIB-like component